MGNKVLDLIIEFVNALKSDEKISCFDSEGKVYTIHHCRYLLGQIIRCYQIPSANYHVSEEAIKLWESITTADINDHSYDETIVCDKADGVQVNKYKGNARVGTKVVIQKNEKLRFNDVFHAEHMVSIKTIVTMLLTQDDLTYERVSGILDHIHVCRITKDEDKRIKQKSNRPFDYEDVIGTVYTPAGIKIWDEKVI